MWETIGKVADVFSIGSLLVSGYAAWQIVLVKRRVTRRLVFHNRADRILDGIRQHAQIIEDLYRDPNRDSLQIATELRRCCEAFHRVRDGVGDQIRQRLGLIRKLQRTYETSEKSRTIGQRTRGANPVLWEIVTELKVFDDDVRAMLADHQAGGSNDI